jgi:vacuole morphology and inheritance protein 14
MPEEAGPSGPAAPPLSSAAAPLAAAPLAQQLPLAQPAAGALPLKVSPAALASVNLAPAIMRALSDRAFEKRKSGAVEIEKAVRDKTDGGEGGGEEYVVTLINLLTMDYACSINSNQRKGGLIGLAGVAMGLGPNGTPKYLQYLLPPVLKCFDDPEVRVRYYACEALYNIAKVARRHVLTYFNGLFDGLCKLFSDVDVDVKNGAQLLDRLVKEIVTENCDTFQVELLIPLLDKYLRLTNPYIRQFLIGWILALDSVPEIDMVLHLPRFLDGVFSMLGDGNREIRQQSDLALARFLAEIRQQAPNGGFEERYLAQVTSTLIAQSGSAHKFSRLTAVTWIHQFVEIFGSRLVLMYAGILSVLLTCLSDQEPEIKAVADLAHDRLLELVRSSEHAFTLKPLIAVVTHKLALAQAHEGAAGAAAASAPAVPLPTRLAALRWLSMLLDKFPSEMEGHLGKLTPAMLAALSDASDELVVLDLDVLARIARNRSRMDTVVGQIVHRFRDDRALFDNRGSFVVRKLCVLLEPAAVFLILAREIEQEQDLDFAHLMVQALNLLLLTAPELSAFRATLRSSWREAQESTEPLEAAGSAAAAAAAASAATSAAGTVSSPTATASASNAVAAVPVFVALFRTWCIDPVAALSLCLLSHCYDLASSLVVKLADVNLTVGFLMEIDKLVQLIESPAFLSLRLELVNSGSAFRPALLKTLYGLLMILPQSQAYNVLSSRLNAAASLHLAISDPAAASCESCNAKLLAASAQPYAQPTQQPQKVSRSIFSKLRSDGEAAKPRGDSEAASRDQPRDHSAATSHGVEQQLLDHFVAAQSRLQRAYEQSVRSRSLVTSQQQQQQQTHQQMQPAPRTPERGRAKA